MKRKETTSFLNNLLEKERLTGLGKYWSREVTIDYGTRDEKRIDYLQFELVNTSISGIEKGIFICYEVKSCKADFNSGYGKNFIGEKNYLVMPMKVYKEVIHDIPYEVGVLTPVPRYRNKHEEFEHPTELCVYEDWKLEVIKPSHQVSRKKSMTELLFCMLRSGH